MVSDPNVLRVNAAEETANERAAVAQILLDIQRDKGLTHIELAERIDVSLGTISNAANKKTDFCRTYLKRLGHVFGAHYLDPWLALCGARAIPLQSGNVRDILPLLAKAATKIAEARDPQSPGKGRETHNEKLAYLPELERLQDELSKAICDIKALRGDVMVAA